MIFSSRNIVCTPSFQLGLGWGVGWVELKKGLDRTLIVREGLVGKRRDLLGEGGGGSNFYIKNKLKSEMFNDKKSL